MTYAQYFNEQTLEGHQLKDVVSSLVNVFSDHVEEGNIAVAQDDMDRLKKLVQCDGAVAKALKPMFEIIVDDFSVRAASALEWLPANRPTSAEDRILHHAQTCLSYAHRP